MFFCSSHPSPCIPQELGADPVSGKLCNRLCRCISGGPSPFPSLRLSASGPRAVIEEHCQETEGRGTATSDGRSQLTVLMLLLWRFGRAVPQLDAGGFLSL